MKRSVLLDRFVVTIFILAPSVVPCALPAWADSQPLQAHVEHSVKLPPVPDGLMQGGKFDEPSLPTLVPKNNWVPIPKWLAGTWQFKSETVTHMNVINDETKYPPTPFVLRNEFQRTIGFQMDKSGQIWDYVKAPYSYTCKVDNDCMAYNRCMTVDTIENSPDLYISRVAGDDSVVEPTSQTILLTQQKECINRFSTMGDDALRIDSSTKIFDNRGNSKLLKISNMMGMRAKPFERIDEKDGDNLRQLFVEYLKSAGKAELVPN